MPKANARAKESLRRDQQANASRRVPSRRSPGRVWVRAYREQDGTYVAGHWREVGSSGGAVLKDDLREHVGRQLSEHAARLQRVAELQAQLQDYARRLSG